MVNKRLLFSIVILLSLGCFGGLFLSRLFDGFIRPTESLPIAEPPASPEVLPTLTPKPQPSQTYTPIFIETSPPVRTPTSVEFATAAPAETNTPESAYLPILMASALRAAPCIPDNAKIEVVRVIRIIDGDTVDVSIDGAEFRVRYIGVDSPEMEFPLGPDAHLENSRLVENREITLVGDTTDTDQYNRLLRYVIADGIFVNYAMVQSGYAMSKAYDPDTACQLMFDQAEAEAKANGLGMWAATPSAPTRLQAGSLMIQNIFYDGLVPRVEGDEYAEISNMGSEPVELAGWRLNAGNPGQDFTFPSFTLEPGQLCRVYTNEIHAETWGFSYTSADPLWNNKGDCGYLYDPSGNLVDDYCY